MLLCVIFKFNERSFIIGHHFVLICRIGERNVVVVLDILSAKRILYFVVIDIAYFCTYLVLICRSKDVTASAIDSNLM